MGLVHMISCAAELSEGGAGRGAEILQFHPQFEELLHKYEDSSSNLGSTMKGALLVGSSNALGARNQFVELLLDCNGKTVPKKLPGKPTSTFLIL